MGTLLFKSGIRCAISVSPFSVRTSLKACNKKDKSLYGLPNLLITNSSIFSDGFRIKLNIAVKASANVYLLTFFSFIIDKLPFFQTVNFLLK
jgi:hypothetical protein